MSQDLEKEIQELLQGLPNFTAPPRLLARTLAAIEQPAPGLFRPWTTWPLAARIGFVFLTVTIAAAAMVALGAIEPGLVSAAARHLAPAAAGAECGWHVMRALTGAVVLAAEHLGAGFMLACFVVAALASAICAGLGTVFVRLAFARPGRNPF